MKQIFQNFRNGDTNVVDVPAPRLTAGNLLIQTSASLISAGSEKTLVEFGKGSLLAKAKAQPDKVKQVLDKIKTDGLMPTMEAVFSKLNEPMPLGYCNAGVVLEIGLGVTEFKPGDRVISNGQHAEIICVPKNLCAKIPDEVTDEQAAFTVLSSIGLQGIRLLQSTLGEKFVVYGLGLIGLITVQLLRAHGCEVLGVDINANRLKLAREYGAKTVNAGAGDPIAAASTWTEGKGVDGVLITAAAKTDEIMHNSAEMCRKRGRIVLVGVVDLNLRRSDFYEKELTFQVSCSYGPGRYDDKYEQAGQDYPPSYVRWTEQRNFEAILSIMSSRALAVDSLITHRFPLKEASKAYDVISTDKNSLGVVLQYPTDISRAIKVQIKTPQLAKAGQPVVGVIGAGSFSKMIMMPSLSKTSAKIAYVADINGAVAQHACKKYGAENAVSDYRLILDDPAVNAVLIAVGHNLHARFVCEILEAGKHAFVEKPLAMSEEELCRIEAAAEKAADRYIMVGFNRRFSPHTLKIKELLVGRSEPLAMNMTINAGIIPPEHWVHDPIRGGGRIIGEACHFMDLMAFLADSPVKTVAACMMGKGVAIQEDKMSIVLGFEDGSIGTVNYFANGTKKYPKEMLEVFSDGRVVRLDNFRRTTGFGFKGFGCFKTLRQNKGHGNEFTAFIKRISEGGPSLIPLDQLTNITRASFAARTSAVSGKMIHL